MAADDWSELLGEPHQGGDVKARVALDFFAGFARALDHDNAFQSRPIVAFLQPSHIMDCRVGSGFNAAVVAVDRLMPADLCILEAVRFLLGRENLDILAKRALVAFERKDVISLLIQDLLVSVVLRPRP